ncbi:ABC transporter permease [Gammaproteobacteria bacterium]|nr:ABC transporter permease [Gammaproteobacteria bacterium]
MMLLRLALYSLINRRSTVSLVVLSIALSVALILGVESIRHNARQSFTQTISGTDLIVGPRTGQIELLLYSVFHIGQPSANLGWQSYEQMRALPGVRWTAPLSLGDSHRGYRVVGTSPSLFEHYRYAGDRPLALQVGAWFDTDRQAVIGAAVAASLNYAIDDQIVIAHGVGAGSFEQHDDSPMTISGILEPSGTPMDRAIFVSLGAIADLHADPLNRRRDKTLSSITAALVGLDSPIATFTVQRAVNQDAREPMMAILPGVALTQLWQVMSLAEGALSAIAIAVAIAAILGMLATTLAGLNERRREMAILRSQGARPWQIVALLVSESLLTTLAAVVLGLLLRALLLVALAPWLLARYALVLPVTWPSQGEWLIIAAFLVAGTLAGLIPAWRAYRRALNDGLSLRI